MTHANHQGEPGDTGTGEFRVGRRVPRNVYRGPGGEPMFMAATAEQAAELVALLNAGSPSAPTPTVRVGSVEKLAAAIDAADHGYSIKLTSLTEAGSVYTLDLCDGSGLIEFADRDDAREHAERHRSLARAKAALAFLSARNGEAQ